MAHVKETPRQKLIGMMYLVLTAMLALNVSAEVLNAFVLFEQGLTKAASIARDKNEQTKLQFVKAYQDNPQKIGVWIDKANKVSEYSDKLTSMMQDIKLEIVRFTEGQNSPAVVGNMVKPELLKSAENTDASSNVMLNNRKAALLKAAIADFKLKIIGLLDGNVVGKEEIINRMNRTLDLHAVHTKDGKKSWEVARFADLPLVAGVAQLSSLQLDVINIESDLINLLLAQTDVGSFKFDNLQAVVSTKGDYIVAGGYFEAEIFIAASDKTKDPVVVMGGRQLPVNEGKGIYKINTSKPGTYDIGGLIKVQKGDGEIVTVPFKHTYYVVEPSVAVSPAKMNVFYRGLENPVEISAAGIPSNKLTVNVSNGRLIRNGAHTYVIPGGESQTVISVAVTENGRTRSLGEKRFRVKNAPSPIPQLDGISGKIASKSDLRASQGIVASMPEDFDFEMNFHITSFTVYATIDGYVKEESARGPVFNDKQRQIIERLSSGQRINITDIRAKGSDGIERTLNDLSIKIR